MTTPTTSTAADITAGAWVRFYGFADHNEPCRIVAVNPQAVTP